MSSDERITKDLIETLEDGKNGYAKGAERLADTNRADLCSRFAELSSQRAAMAEELRALAAAYGDGIDEQGSVTAAVHRGWMAVKDAFSGSDAEGVLDVAEQGEDHAKAEFERALDEDISAELRAVVQRQYAEVCAAHDWVKAQRNATV
jgi:uncharacterized protein (TIGR02284 family)